MIGTLDIQVQAQNPNFPLDPLYAYVDSPSTIIVRGVPQKVGEWSITTVKVEISYPDNTKRTYPCIVQNGTYVCTVPGSSRSGKFPNGYSVIADGIDEGGGNVIGYVLGKGDVFIMDETGTIRIDGTQYYIHYLNSQPQTPHTGDIFKDGTNWKLYNGTSWIPFGGLTYTAGSGLTLTGTEFALDGTLPTKVSELQNDSGFITSSSVPSKTSQLENDSGFVTASSIPPATKVWSATSAIESPESGDCYINGAQEVWTWSVDESFTYGSLVLHRGGKPKKWIKVNTAISIEFDTTNSKWIYRPDAYQTPCETPGLFTDMQVTFRHNNVDKVFVRSINNQWVLKSKLVDKTDSSLSSIANGDTLLAQKGRLSVNKTNIPYIRDIECWGSTPSLDTSYFENGTYWCIVGGSSGDSYSSFQVCGESGIATFTCPSGGLRVGNTYKVVTCWPGSSQDGGYIEFRVQNDARNGWDSLTFSGTPMSWEF